ncbi:2-oxoglutarate dehydrogenase E1 component, partial [Ceratobasidium sp. 392]
KAPKSKIILTNIPRLLAPIHHPTDKALGSTLFQRTVAGHLTVLANLLCKLIEAILKESIGTDDAEGSASSDIKYHLGANYARPTPLG